MKLKIDSPFAGVQAVLFDVDGTLADTVAMIVAGLGDTFEHFIGQRPEPSFLQSLIGMPLSKQMNLLGLEQQADSTLSQRIDFAMARFSANKAMSQLFEPAVQAMNQLQKHGIPVALVTSKNRDEVNELVEQFPVLASVDSISCASDVMNPKPAPDPVLHACQLLQVSPERTVLIGDTIYDIQSAQLAGAKSIAVTYGAGSLADLESARPDFLVYSPSELLKLTHEHILLTHEQTYNNSKTDSETRTNAAS